MKNDNKINNKASILEVYRVFYKKNYQVSQPVCEQVYLC